MAGYEKGEAHLLRVCAPESLITAIRSISRLMTINAIKRRLPLKKAWHKYRSATTTSVGSEDDIPFTIQFG